MLQMDVIDAVPLNEVTTPILEEPDYEQAGCNGDDGSSCIKLLRSI